MSKEVKVIVLVIAGVLIVGTIFIGAAGTFLYYCFKINRTVQTYPVSAPPANAGIPLALSEIGMLSSNSNRYDEMSRPYLSDDMHNMAILNNSTPSALYVFDEKQNKKVNFFTTGKAGSSSPIFWNADDTLLAFWYSSNTTPALETLVYNPKTEELKHYPDKFILGWNPKLPKCFYYKTGNNQLINQLNIEDGKSTLFIDIRKVTNYDDVPSVGNIARMGDPIIHPNFSYNQFFFSGDSQFLSTNQTDQGTELWYVPSKETPYKQFLTTTNKMKGVIQGIDKTKGYIYYTIAPADFKWDNKLVRMELETGRTLDMASAIRVISIDPSAHYMIYESYRDLMYMNLLSQKKLVISLGKDLLDNKAMLSSDGHSLAFIDKNFHLYMAQLPHL